MYWKETAQQWLNTLTNDDPLKQQLLNLQSDEKALEDCFYTDIAFGTGGMRGLIGPGTNRMNIFTIRKAAAGLSQHIVNAGSEAMKRGIAIAYDSRHFSQEFALEVAETAGTFGIKTFLFEDIQPTPVLSFAVRHLNTYAGVVITASHNPPEYNGFKVYGSDGAQMLPEEAEQVIQYADEVGSSLHIEVETESTLLEKDLLTFIGKDVEQAYLKHVQMLQTNKKPINQKLSIVFTPLHGTAGKLVPEGLEHFGFTDVHLVEKQMLADPNFSTIATPNPEEQEAFSLAIEEGKKVNADILMATDPDADRIGVAVKNKNNQYELLSGNQIGALLVHYLLSTYKENGTLPNNGAILKTIVTSELGENIAKDFGVKSFDTLTGFKFIAEQMNSYEKSKVYTFLFGYEESFGYLIGDFVRDKDAVQLAIVIAEMAAYYKQQDKTLYEALHALFEQYGYYQESLHSITFEGKDGVEQMNALMDTFRKEPIKKIANEQINTVEDYETGEKLDIITGETEKLTLPKSNVLKYKLKDDSWFCIRPSGTEPKCKFYFSVREATESVAQKKLQNLEKSVLNLVSEKR